MRGVRARAVGHGLLALLLAAVVGVARADGDAPGLVAVDVGHTLEAPGATSARGRGEFEFNRDLSVHVVDALRARGWAVGTINADGRIASLRARPQAAGEAGAAFLLSLHHDSVNAFELRPWTWEGRALDYNDELVFMARDAGGRVAKEKWPTPEGLERAERAEGEAEPEAVATGKLPVALPFFSS